MHSRLWPMAMWLAASAPALAQAPATHSAPITDVQYEVTFDASRAETRTLGVSMTFHTSGAQPVLLSLPVWTPGAYEVSNFARKVLNFTAATGDQPLAWDKLDYDTWRVRPTGAQHVTVRFEYVADTLDNAMSWSTEDFALFNGTNVFLYPEAQPLEFPARVMVRTETDWQVATGMASAGQPREYQASNYHDLVDMPFFVGPLEMDSAQIDGAWYRVASYPRGALSGQGRAALWQQLRGIVPPMRAVFPETPWTAYTILLIFTPDYPGGSALEHQNSHVGIYNEQFVGHPLLASITAHEIFHAWNVKRLRPAEMVPYAYSEPQPTTLLWVSEGITDYYADLALVRGGVIPPGIFYQVTAGKITETIDESTALEDASLSTWIDPVDGSRYSYYSKGSLAGFLLDILIRDASDNRTSLDDVLGALYAQTYRQGRGFTTEEWWRAVSRAAGGKSFDDFHRRYVDGRDPFPYADVLPLAGLALRADTARVPRIGVTTTADSTGVRITAVAPGTSAAEAGLAAGDYLLRVGEITVTDPSFGVLFRQLYGGAEAGSPITYTVRRGDETLTVSGRLGFGENVTYEIVELPNAGEKALRIRQGILRGNP